MIDLQIWSFPLSIILAAAFVLFVFLCSKSRTTKYLGWLSSRNFALITIIASIVLIAIEGTWSLQLYHNWAFITMILLLMIPLGVITIVGIRRKTSLYAFFSHAGLLLILFGGLFGAADVTESQIVVSRHQSEHLSFTTKGQIVPLPFEIQLKDFIIDYYEDEISPKQYTSIITIDGKEMQTTVNSPCRYAGWDIYQSDYDPYEMNYSVLKLVRDPWIPVVYVGMLLLVIGAMIGMKYTWRSKKVIPFIIALTVLFTVLSLARINLGHLMPALRSLWFYPHIIIYMVAYSVLAVASVMGIVYLKRGKTTEIPQKLLTTASSLLLIGMLCGAVWAKQAWGQYWTWDAKEDWAAVTWLITVVGAHLPQYRRQLWIAIVIWISFLAMQITWYGVNYLPSSQYSMHTYNS